MPVINRIADFHADMKTWRHDIHAHPEMAFKEHRTSDLVAQALASLGIEVHRGLAGTGVVGTLRAGSGTRACAPTWMRSPSRRRPAARMPRPMTA
jgi:hippurate hydrolase